MKFLKQTNINSKRITDKSVFVDSDGIVSLRPRDDKNIEMQSERALLVPAGTSSKRPIPQPGLVRFNTTAGAFEGYNGLAWSSLGGVQDIDGDTYILAEPFPGADTDTLLFYASGVLSTTIDSLGINSRRLAGSQLDLIETGADGITQGTRKATIRAGQDMTSSYALTLPNSIGVPGTFLGVGISGQLLFEGLDQAGNRVYVSAKVGDDTNDGILKPVKTLRRALQIAAGLVYSPTVQYNEAIFLRDTLLVLDSIIFDAVYDSNWRSVKAGLAYYAAQVVMPQKSQTIAALQFLKVKVLAMSDVISNASITKYASRLDDVIAIFDLGINSAPGFGGAGSIFMTDPLNADSGFIIAKELLLDNVDFIADEAVAWTNAQISSNITPFNTQYVYNSAEFRRAFVLITYSVIYDMTYGGNTQSRDAGLKYYDAAEGGSASNQLQIPGQVDQTVAALNRIRLVAQQVAQNIPVTTSGTLLNPQQFSSPGGSPDAATRIGELFDIVSVITANGPSFAVIQVLPTADRAAQPSADQLILESAKSRIASNVIAYTSDYRPNGVNITAAVASGEYNEENPLIIPDNVSVIGDGLRSCIIRPLNSNKDMFKIRNGCYFTEFTFRDRLDQDRIPTSTWNYAFSFDDPLDIQVNRVGYQNLPISKPTITTSPYMQNCSMISFLGGNGVLVDGDKVQVPNIPNIPNLAEKPVDLSDGVPQQGKSMVANAFTMISFGGTGWRLINDAYAQLVSCFQIFMLNGTYCQSGGYVSITNSATNFGKYALRASGYSPNSFTFDRGYIAGNGLFQGEQTLKVIGYGRVPINHFVLRFLNLANEDITETFKPALVQKNFDGVTAVDLITDVITITAHGYVESQEVLYVPGANAPIGGLDENQAYYVSIISPNQIRLYFDEDKTLLVDLTTTSSGTHSFLTNVEEFFANTIVDSHNVYQRLTLAPGSYTFTIGATIAGSVDGFTNSAFVYSYDAGSQTLVVSINPVAVGSSQERVLFTPTSSINSDQGTATNIVINNAVRLRDLYSAEFTVKSTVTNNNLANISSLTGLQLYFHRPSIVNSSSHTWEYAGSGIDYNALPQNGGQTDTQYEQFSELPGRVYSSGTNELGDFKVGDFIVAENKTGNISFRNKVIVSELTALKLSLSDVEIQALSIDIGLGDNEPGGAANSRLSTQLAIRTFLKNRLGKFIDKDLSTNAVPGSVVQLNSSGQINSDLIPATRNFSVSTARGYLGRTRLANAIPATSILAGDISSEEYEKIEITLDSTVAANGNDGDLIVQANSGATGYLIGNATNASIIQVGSIEGTFALQFNDTDDIQIGGSTPVAISAVSNTVAESVNYFLATDSASQFLILNTDYAFTLGETVTSVINQAQGTITAEINGVATALNNVALSGGTGYVPTVGSVTYKNVLLTGGAGTGALADITVSNGSVSIVNLTQGGAGYQINDVLSANYINLGNVTPSPAFSIVVSAVENRLYVNLIGNLKFIAVGSSPDFTEGDTASVIIIDLTATTTLAVAAPSVANQVNYTTSRISTAADIFFSGDPVQYNTGGSIAIGGLVNGSVYYVKSISATSIELYTEYALINKVTFTADSTGTHTLQRHSVIPEINSLVYVNHGYTTGDSIRIEGADLPAPISNNSYFYVGSVTPNSFTLHTNRGEALNSVLGVSINEAELVDIGSGSATLTKQNVTIVGTVNTSSTNTANWKLVNSSNIDASGIISGVISTTRLAFSGVANSNSYLRGDSVWAPAVSQLTRTTNDSPITINGDGSETGFYGDVSIDIARVDGVSGTALYTNLGTARFLKEQFAVGTDAGLGNVSIRNGVIDAGTLDGLDSSYFLNPANLTSSVPIGKGGTGLSVYVTGDLLFANSAVTFGKIAIGAKNRLLAVTEPVSGTLYPGWVDSISVSSVDIDFTKIDTGSTSITNTVPTIVDSFDKSTYRSAKYIVQITNLTDLSYLTTEVLLVHNGNTVSRITEFASISTNNVAKGTFSTNIAANNVRLIFTSNNSNSLQIKLLKTYIGF